MMCIDRLYRCLCIEDVPETGRRLKMLSFQKKNNFFGFVSNSFPKINIFHLITMSRNYLNDIDENKTNNEDDDLDGDFNLVCVEQVQLLLTQKKIRR